MSKWIVAIFTIIIFSVVLSGCRAGVSVGPEADPYGDANFGIKQAK